MKTTELWISNWRNYIQIWRTEPRWGTKYHHWSGSNHEYTFCKRAFWPLMPSLRMPKNSKCRLRITHYKSGDKLSLVGKPIKAGE